MPRESLFLLRLCLLGCLPALLLFLYPKSSFGAPIPESAKPIRIILNNWTSQQLLARITGGIFEQLGYTVEYHDYPVTEQWGAMYRGLYHVQVEVWEGTMASMFNRGLENGTIVDAGQYHDISTREDWWYPSYVEEMCPGLPDWKALRDCAHLFATPETKPKGVYLAGPWEKPDLARVRALELPFEVVKVSQGNDLKQALDYAVNRRQAIVLFNWTPNWTGAQYEGSFVEFPEYSPDCEHDAAWGVNPAYVQDCGNPKSGWLKKAAWARMPEIWPCAFKTLHNIDFTTSMITRLIYLVDVEKVPQSEVVAEWLEKGIWQSWIPDECRAE